MFMLYPIYNLPINDIEYNDKHIKIYIVVCHYVTDESEVPYVLYPSFLSKDDAEKYVEYLYSLDDQKIRSKYYQIYETVLSVPVIRHDNSGDQEK